MCPPAVADRTFPGPGCSKAPTFPRDFPAVMADGRGGGDGRVCLSSFLSWCVETKRGGIPSGSSGRIATFSSSSADGPYSTGKAVLMTSGSCRRNNRSFSVCSYHTLKDTSSSCHAMISTHPTTQSPHSRRRGCRRSAVRCEMQRDILKIQLFKKK